MTHNRLGNKSFASQVVSNILLSKKLKKEIVKLSADRALKLVFNNGLPRDLGQIKSEGGPKIEGHLYSKTLSIPIFLFIRTSIFHL